MSTLPDGVRAIESIEDAGPLVILDHEVDLDDLMLAIAGEGWDEFGGPSTGRTWEHYHDEPTSIWGSTDYGVGAHVGWFRRIPANRGNCLCGNGHAWDLHKVNADEKPEGNKARGAFLGVWFA